MSDRSKIDYVDASWNPVTGCSKISTGCMNCWAARTAKRLAGRFGYPADKPFRVTLHPDRLEQPLHWRKPRRIFVCSMGDLFHPDVPDEFIDKVVGVMALCLQHSFLVLTKRIERAVEWFGRNNIEAFIECARRDFPDGQHRSARERDGTNVWGRWPLPNVWLGTTVENQDHVSRIDDILKCPAAVRFLSLEPLLGDIDLTPWFLLQRIGWVIVGCESGPGARPMDPDWVRSIRDQCQAAGVSFYLKQMMVNGKLVKLPMLDGRQWTEMPDR